MAGFPKLNTHDKFRNTDCRVLEGNPLIFIPDFFQGFSRDFARVFPHMVRLNSAGNKGLALSPPFPGMAMVFTIRKIQTFNP
jgi:hypothetical protein